MTTTQDLATIGTGTATHLVSATGAGDLVTLCGAETRGGAARPLTLVDGTWTDGTCRSCRRQF